MAKQTLTLEILIQNINSNFRHGAIFLLYTSYLLIMLIVTATTPINTVLPKGNSILIFIIVYIVTVIILHYLVSLLLKRREAYVTNLFKTQIDTLAWAYKKVTVYNLLIPSTSYIFCFANRKIYQVRLRGYSADEVLGFIYEIAPNVVIGYSRNFETLYRRSPSSLLSGRRIISGD